MKISIKTAIIIAAVILAVIGFLIANNAHLRGKLATSVPQAQYDQLKKTTAADMQTVQDQKKQLQQTIQQKSDEINKIKSEAGQPSDLEKKQASQITDQAQKLSAYEAQGDLKDALESANAEINSLKQEYTLAESRHSQELAQLDSTWQSKFNALQAIDQGKDKLIADLTKQDTGCDALVAALHKQIAKEKTASIVKDCIIGGIIAGLVYSVVKK